MGKIKSTSGNALIFVLLAVALLGFLTVVLVRSSGNTEETGDIEKVTIGVSQMLRFTSAVQATVIRMLANGVSENEISFANTVYQTCANASIQGAGSNPKCTRPDCEMFNVAGGGLKPMELPASIVSTSTCSFWKNGAMAIDLKTIDGVGKDNNDELLLEVNGLTKEACLKINQLLDIPAVSGDAPVDDIAGGSLFTGTFTTFGPRIGNEYAGFIGKKNLCLKNAGGGYSFFSVLIPK